VPRATNAYWIAIPSASAGLLRRVDSGGGEGEKGRGGVRGPGWLRCWVGPVSRRLIGRGRARVCGVVFGRGGLSLLPAWFWYRGDGGSGSRDGKMVCPTLAGVRYVHCALAGCYIFVLFHCYCCYLEYSLTNALLMKLSRERRNDTNKFTAVLRCHTPVPNSKKRPLQSPRTNTPQHTAQLPTRMRPAWFWRGRVVLCLNPDDGKTHGAAPPPR
jgi:hypothetical protein